MSAPHVLAIVRREQCGKLQRVDAIECAPGENVLLIPVSGGVVAVPDDLTEAEEGMIERIVSELENGCERKRP